MKVSLGLYCSIPWPSKTVGGMSLFHFVLYTRLEVQHLSFTSLLILFLYFYALLSVMPQPPLLDHFRYGRDLGFSVCRGDHTFARVSTQWRRLEELVALPARQSCRCFFRLDRIRTSRVGDGQPLFMYQQVMELTSSTWHFCFPCKFLSCNLDLRPLPTLHQHVEREGNQAGDSLAASPWPSTASSPSSGLHSHIYS
jgi:hypothetical protein